MGHGGGDACSVVGYDEDFEKTNAEATQEEGEVAAVRVLDLPREDFVADHEGGGGWNDFVRHGTRRRPLVVGTLDVSRLAAAREEDMRRVLIVEDSNAVRMFVRGALEEEDFQRAVGGFDIVEAPSGVEAMAQLSRGVFACIVTDINMGDINGLEIVNFVRKSEVHKETPVVIISTQSSQRDIDRGLALGANAYLPKPFSAEALCDVVRRFVAPGEG